MSATSALNSVATNTFTDEMLAKNFVSIANGFEDFDKLIGHVEGHVAELSKTVQTLVAKAPRGSKFKPFVLGAVVGIAVYKYATKNGRKIELVVEDVKSEAAARLDSLKGNINGSSNTKNGPGTPA